MSQDNQMKHGYTGARHRLLVVTGDIQIVEALRTGLTASQHLFLCGAVTRFADVFDVLRMHQPEWVLVGSFPEMEVSLLCQQIRFYFPQVACLAICTGEEAHEEPLLQRLGVSILRPPIVAEQVEMVAWQTRYGGGSEMDGSVREASAPLNSRASFSAPMNNPPPKQIITVYGPKGGVGKTFLSRELAIFFTMQQREGKPLKVLAIDCNLDLGTFATTLNLTRTPNLFTWAEQIEGKVAHLIRQEGRDPTTLSHQEWLEYADRLALRPAEVSQFIVTHAETGLHVLTSPRDIRHSFEMKDYHLSHILETVKQSDYDVILIDTAPDTTDATIQALFFADRVVMVGNPVVDAIENIHRMLKLLREAEYPEERIQVCINRLQRREMFTVDEMKAYFQLHPSKKIFTIPDDDEVKRSINTGVPLMCTTGRSAAKEAIEKLGRSLVPLTEDDAREPTETRPQTKKRFSLLDWLKSGF